MTFAVCAPDRHSLATHFRCPGMGDSGSTEASELHGGAGGAQGRPLQVGDTQAEPPPRGGNRLSVIGGTEVQVEAQAGHAEGWRKRRPFSLGIRGGSVSEMGMQAGVGA